MDHIESNSFSLLGQSTFAEMKSAGSFFEVGDVLYGRLRPYLNKVHRAKFRGVASAEFIVFPETDGLNGDYLKYLMHQKPFVDFAMERASGDRPRVKFDALADFVFGLPPLAEQERIVEKIETLFVEIDKGEEALRAVRKLLARYRQAVLKAAVTGALTADWRATNGRPTETGQDLLTRILKHRRATWRGRGGYKEPAAPRLHNLPDLPDTWVWTSLDTLLVDGPTNGVSPKECDEGGSLSFKLTATTSGKFIIDDNTVKRVAIGANEGAKYYLSAGDVLVQRGNTIEYVGTAATFPGPSGTFIYPDLMMRIRIADADVAEWAVRWINFEFAKRHMRDLATGTAGNMPKINSTTLRTLPVPLPPTGEIKACLAMLADIEAKAEPVGDWVVTEAKRSAALRQSILKDAFAGKLVPQDPADEPAADLLARIRASQAAALKRTRRKAMA